MKRARRSDLVPVELAAPNRDGEVCGREAETGRVVFLGVCVGLAAGKDRAAEALYVFRYEEASDWVIRIGTSAGRLADLASKPVERAGAHPPVLAGQ